MTEYTMTYTLEITENHQAEEENPSVLLRLAQHMLEQKQWAREQLGADDVHLREYRVSVSTR